MALNQEVVDTVKAADETLLQGMGYHAIGDNVRAHAAFTRASELARHAAHTLEIEDVRVEQYVGKAKP